MGSDEDSSGECFKSTWARVTLGKSFEGSSLQLGWRRLGELGLFQPF